MRAIFENDKHAIDECDVVVANLNGVITDDGTAWELGYAYARGKYIIGLHTDWRKRFEHGATVWRKLMLTGTFRHSWHGKESTSPSTHCTGDSARTAASREFWS